MPTVAIESSDALNAYKKADKAGKLILANLMPKLFSQNIMDRIQGWDDILEISGRDAKEFELRLGETADELAYRQAKLIAEVYNGDNVLYASDTNQRKYYPWHEVVNDVSKPSGFGLSYNDYDNWNSNSNVSVHLCGQFIAVQTMPTRQKKTSLI